MARLAEARWTEYVPSRIHIRPDETMNSVLRRSFERGTLTPGDVANGFAFLREATASLLPLELLSLWEEVALPDAKHPSQVPYDLIRGLALMTAALDLSYTEAPQSGAAPASAYRPGAAQRKAQEYEQWLCDFADAAVLPPDSDAVPTPHLTATVQSVDRYVGAVKAKWPLRRSEGSPEDFSLVSARKRGQAAECVLSTLLLLKMCKDPALSCTLVGTDLVFPWVRIERARGADGAARSTGPPVFASWSYGAMSRSDVERRIHTTDGQWSRLRESPGDAAGRRSILVLLLKKQLSSLSSNEVRARGKSSAASSLCKEQLIHLLSL